MEPPTWSTWREAASVGEPAHHGVRPWKSRAPERVPTSTTLRDGHVLGCTSLRSCARTLKEMLVTGPTALSPPGSLARRAGACVSLEHFGASAPAGVLYEPLGITAERVAEAARASLSQLDAVHPATSGAGTPTPGASA